jgi:abhydrolase domain-containing protein 6
MLRRKGGMTLKQVQVGEFNWPYLEGGNPNGPTVVLVHGFGGDKDNWSFYAPHLTKTYRLISPDLPGFGANDRSMNRSYKMAEQAARLHDFLSALGIDKCHIGGNSMGGYIALHYALAFPQRLRSLTLFNNAGVIGTGESELQKIAATGANPLAIREPGDVAKMMAFVAHKPRPLPAAFQRLMFDDAKAHEALLDSIFWGLAEEAEKGALNDRLGDVKTPTQIIWGRHDRLIDVSCAEVEHAGIKGSELVIMDHIGHVPMIEDPAGTAAHHLPFLAKH